MSELYWIAVYRGVILPAEPYSDLGRVWDVNLFENLTRDQWQCLKDLADAADLPYRYAWREMPADDNQQGQDILARWREATSKPF